MDDHTKWATLLNYKEYMWRIKLYRAKYIESLQAYPENPITTPPIDFMTLHKANLRTSFKLTTACTICGAQSDLQNHHIKPIKHGQGKFTGYKGFDKLVASLGRKQITVCRPCHNSIHSGQYNNIALEDLYDLRLASPESHIRIPSPKTDDPHRKKTGNRNSKVENIIIDDTNKTYLNLPYKIYLQQNYDKFDT